MFCGSKAMTGFDASPDNTIHRYTRAHRVNHLEIGYNSLSNELKKKHQPHAPGVDWVLTGRIINVSLHTKADSLPGVAEVHDLWSPTTELSVAAAATVRRLPKSRPKVATIGSCRSSRLALNGTSTPYRWKAKISFCCFLSHSTP